MRRTNKLSDKCSALSVKNGFEIIYKKLFYHAEFLFILTEYLKRLAQSIVGWIASLNHIFEAHKSPERNKTRRTHEYALFISTSANINPASKFTGKQNYIFINIIMCVCVCLCLFFHQSSSSAAFNLLSHWESRDMKRFRGLSDLRAFHRRIVYGISVAVKQPATSRLTKQEER